MRPIGTSSAWRERSPGGHSAHQRRSSRPTGRKRNSSFANSAVLPDAKLAIFGDIFATPAWLPGNNVFSIGDVLIWLGLAWLLWRTCRIAYQPRHAVVA